LAVLAWPQVQVPGAVVVLVAGEEEFSPGREDDLPLTVQVVGVTFVGIAGSLQDGPLSVVESVRSATGEWFRRTRRSLLGTQSFSNRTDIDWTSSRFVWDRLTKANVDSESDEKEDLHCAERMK